MSYPLLGLTLRIIKISGVEYYEWYSSTLNMSSKIFAKERATPEILQEEKDSFIAREIHCKNPKLPTKYATV